MRPVRWLMKALDGHDRYASIKELKEALSAEEYEMVTAASEFKIKWFFFGNSDKNTEEEHTKESD